MSLMTEERRIYAKQISDKVVSGIYKSVLYCIVFVLICVVAFFFLYPYYQEYAYKNDCLQNGHQKEWCEKTWQELSELD